MDWLNLFGYGTPDYAWTDYRKYTSMIADGLEKISLPDLDEAQTFLWDYKEVIIGGVTAIGVAIVARKCFRNKTSNPHRVRAGTALKAQSFQTREDAPIPMKTVTQSNARHPPQPIIKSLNTEITVKFSVEMPKALLLPPNVNIVFCIDKSSSMIPQDRQGAVKRGGGAVFIKAEEVVRTVKDAKIQMAMVTFNTKAEILCSPTEITARSSGRASSIESLKSSLGSYQSSGGTDIISGLSEAVSVLNEMAEKNIKGRNVVVLLCDGEDSVPQLVIENIQKRLPKNSELDTIGIGAGHRKDTMIQIAKGKGQYRDTTELDEYRSPKITIEGAISEFFTQAITQGSKVTLKSTLLAGVWRVGTVFSVKGKNGSKCQLGKLSPTETKTYKIVIDVNKLRVPIDLSKLSFDLICKDSRGQKTTVQVPLTQT